MSPSDEDNATLEELAIHYAMIHQPGYQSYKFTGNSTEHELDRIFQKMGNRFGYYNAQVAIKQAEETLQLVAFHKG